MGILPETQIINQTMAKLQIDLTGTKGLAKRLAQDVNRSAADVNLRYDIADGQMVDGIYNPLMRLGYLYPATSPAMTLTVPTIADDFFSSYVSVDSGLVLSGQDDNMYGYDNSFTSGGHTYTYDTLDGVKIESKVDTGKNVYDIELYMVNGTEKLFYIATNNVGIMTTAFGSNDNDWLSTVPVGGSTLHGTGLTAFLRRADNGFLYVFDTYAVHKIDGGPSGGTNGTVVMDALVFPSGIFQIFDAVDTRGRMYIAIGEDAGGIGSDDKNIDVGYYNFCGVYVWDRRTTVATMQDFITVESASFIRRIWVHADGGIYMMTTGTRGQNQIRKFDGSKFTVIFELPSETKISVKDGLTVAEGMTFWAGDDGYIYMMGDVGSGLAVFKIAQYTTGALEGAGGTVIAYMAGSSFTAASGYRALRPQIVVGYRPSGQNCVVKKFYLYGTGTLTDTNGDDGSGSFSPIPFVANQGDVYTGVQLLPDLSTVNYVDIRCAPTGTGSATIATVKYYFNQSTTPFASKVITKDQASRGYVIHQLAKPYANAIQIEIEWDTSNILGADDFSPYLAIIDYTPTNVKKGP